MNKRGDSSFCLEQKDRLRLLYDLSERELSRYAKEAAGSAKSREFLLKRIETRLDNVIYRLGIAGDRAQAKKLIRRGCVLLNGSKMEDFSRHVGPRDIIETKCNSPQESLSPPPWLVKEDKNLWKVLRLPGIGEIKIGRVDVSCIIDYYNKL